MSQFIFFRNLMKFFVLMVLMRNQYDFIRYFLFQLVNYISISAKGEALQSRAFEPWGVGSTNVEQGTDISPWTF